MLCDVATFDGGIISPETIHNERWNVGSLRIALIQRFIIMEIRYSSTFAKKCYHAIADEYYVTYRHIIRYI